MKIALLNHYAGSPRHGMEFRPFYLAREWRKHGHDVTIVAATESHVRQRAPVTNGAPVTEEIIEGVRYVWIATPPYAGNGVRRAFNMAAFVFGVIRHRYEVLGAGEFDAIIASSTYPLDIIAANALARASRAAVVFEVHDLWPLSPMELGGMSPDHPFIRVMQWAEDKAYRDADRVVSLLPGTLDHMLGRGMSADKFAYIPNGIDSSEWIGRASGLPQAHVDVFDEIRRKGNTVVGYAGSHGVANALDVMLDAANQLRDEPVAFVLVGHGPAKQALERRAADLGLNNVRFLEPVSKPLVPILLAQFDIACFTSQTTPMYKYGISPNKLFDYMMAGRPVLQALSAGYDLVAESRCGLSVAGEDPTAVADAVRDLVSRPRAELDAMGMRGREFVLRYHDYRILAEQFLVVVADAIQRRTAGAGRDARN